MSNDIQKRDFKRKVQTKDLLDLKEILLFLGKSTFYDDEEKLLILAGLSHSAMSFLKSDECTYAEMAKLPMVKLDDKWVSIPHLSILCFRYKFHLKTARQLAWTVNEWRKSNSPKKKEKALAICKDWSDTYDLTLEQSQDIFKQLRDALRLLD